MFLIERQKTSIYKQEGQSTFPYGARCLLAQKERSPNAKPDRVLFVNNAHEFL